MAPGPRAAAGGGPLLSLDQLGRELGAVMPGLREVPILWCLVVMQAVESAARGFIDGIDRPDPSVQLAPGAVTEPERDLALP